MDWNWFYETYEKFFVSKPLHPYLPESGIMVAIREMKRRSLEEGTKEDGQNNADSILVKRQDLIEMLAGWEEGSQYKGEYLRNKHGDVKEIARYRATYLCEDK